MNIISIDPGYERLGIALIEKSKPKDTLLYSDCFKTPAEDDFEDRLFAIGSEVERLIKKYKPQAMALEKLFFNTNQKTAMHVAEVRGALMYIAKKHTLTLFEYTPLQIKNAVTGHGQSDKKQIMTMLPHLIDISKDIQHDDEYDAIAVGLTCLASTRF